MNHDPALTSSCAYVRRIGLQKESNWVVHAYDECSVEITRKRENNHLFIAINWAIARDMAYSSPEAWRKYLCIYKEVTLVHKWKDMQAGLKPSKHKDLLKFNHISCVLHHCVSQENVILNHDVANREQYNWKTTSRSSMFTGFEGHYHLT